MKFLLNQIGIVALNVTTFEVFVTQLIDNEMYSNTITLINSWKPFEIIMSESQQNGNLHSKLIEVLVNVHFSFIKRKLFNEDQGKESFIKENKEFSLSELNKKYLAMAAFGAMFNFFREHTDIAVKSNCLKVKYHHLDKFLFIDFYTAKQLELLFNTKNGKKELSLIDMFSPVTVGGTRLLRACILQPSACQDELRARYEAVDRFIGCQTGLGTIRAELANFQKFDLVISKFVHNIDDHSSDALIKSKLIAFSRLVEFIKHVPVLLDKLQSAFPEKPLVLENEELVVKTFYIIKDEILRVVENVEVNENTGSRVIYLIKRGGDNLIDVSLDTLAEIEKEVDNEFEYIKSETGELSLKKHYNEVNDYFFVSDKQIESNLFVNSGNQAVI